MQVAQSVPFLTIGTRNVYLHESEIGLKNMQRQTATKLKEPFFLFKYIFLRLLKVYKLYECT